MGRAPCCDKNGLKKGPWTPEEDQKLIDYIHMHGQGSWRALPNNAGLKRCGKSCRLRWTNYLRPDIKRGRFSFEEEEAIIHLHSVLGNKWSAIAARLPGRTDNEIKNYWNTHIRKRLLRMGIDPVTHTPRLDLLNLSSIYNPTQLQLCRLLGIDPLLNSELLGPATTLLSAQLENSNLISQALPQNQFPTPQIQTPFPSFQAQQQLQTTLQNIPTCTTSNTQIFNEAQLMQANVDQINFSVEKIAESNLHQGNGLPCNCDENFASLLNCNYYNSNSSIMDPISESSIFRPGNNQSFNLNTPATGTATLNSPSRYMNSNSSPTPLNSCSTHMNSNSSPTPLNSCSTHMNSSTEDERESYCSNMLNFDIPHLLDVSDFM